MILSHRIAMDPTPAQAAALARAAGVARFTWNWALERWNTTYAAGGKPNANALKKEWNALKGDLYPWVYESPKDANQQPFAHLRKAWRAFFEGRARRPRFKRKGVHDAFYVSNDKVALEGKWIRLPVIGWVRTRERLRFPGRVQSVTVSRTADRWYASVAVDVGVWTKPRTGDGVVGVDLGLTTFATSSDGAEYRHPRALRVALARLRRLGRRVARRQKGSKGRARARLALAKAHARVANVRNDFLHKLTTTFCRENQAVVVENLNVRGMLRNRKLSRAIADAGWGEFRRQLAYKAEVYGAELVVAPRFYPSSKRCSACGVVKRKLPLCERRFECGACGHGQDRDLNAALNLRNLAAPGQGAVNARGGSVRPEGASAPEGSPVEARTCTHFLVGAGRQA